MVTLVLPYNKGLHYFVISHFSQEYFLVRKSDGKIPRKFIRNLSSDFDKVYIYLLFLHSATVNNS